MRRYLMLITLLPFCLIAQKKTLDHDSYDIWRNVEDRLISNNGKHVAYSLKNNSVGNEEIMLKTHAGELVMKYDRSSDPKFTNNSEQLVFKISPDVFELRELKRKKTKEKDLPGDTLGIYSISGNSLEKISGLKSFKVPKKWDGYVFYTFTPKVDTTAAGKKHKKRNKKNGYDLAIKDLSTSETYVFNYVTDFDIAEEGAGLALVSTGNDSTIQKGVYRFDFNAKEFQPVFRSKGKYYDLNWDKQGQKFSFISDLDTTKALMRDYHLHLWADSDSSKTISSNASWEQLNVNHQFNSYFSESGNRLFFQVKEHPVLQDTSLLDEEIVKVEVWSYTDPRLHTQQKIDKKNDEKFGYLAYYDLGADKTIKLGGPHLTSVRVSNENDGSTAIGMNNRPHRQLVSWEGFPLPNDLYEINISTGQSTLLRKKIRGTVRTSPLGKYAYWYDYADSAWFTYSFASKKIAQVTTNEKVRYYNEIHDTPSHPWPYGVMSWTEEDEKMLVYDRYDIWEIDPNGATPKRITDGRPGKLAYRYQKLDPEERFISKGQKLILTGFHETDKRESIFSFTYGKNQPKKLVSGNYAYNDIKKARDSKQVIFTQENFQVFPDILSSDLTFKKPKKISRINPQQSQYNWGTAELYKWTSLDGEELEGMLIKPENFDPNKKYPLLVNFYEKSSNGLNNHREPSPGRSTMNYSFYASRGYVIFNPNVNYRDGYPGESAYNCVIPGITSLVSEGFIDKDNIGVQGHSWGGYQVAYLITKTDMFKCAEAGAPVPNMISAYGGIRWWTGLSRMFQYEHTQSRIGGTLWEYPMRFIENSPIFYLDKVNTPVLIMHNDADGHVPWYQGIEYFVGLRRLGKPAWMLNYQGEPHWPVKVQNRIDFNIRLAQYFDHYLKGAPKPKWMRDGVPAMEVGINQGYELLDEE